MQFALAPGCGQEIASPADLDAYLGAVAAAGFDAVSLSSTQLEPAGATGRRGLDRVAQMLAAHGLACTDVMSLAVRGQPRDEVETARRLTDAAAVLGAGSVLTLCMTRTGGETMDRLDRLADIAAQAGVQLSLEFCPGLAVDSIAAGMAVVDQLGRDRMGLTVDTWHFFRGASTWAQLAEVPLDSVLVVQFDDAPPAVSQDVLAETTHRRVWPGHGEFDLERFVATLTARGFAGVVSVEVLSTETRELDLATYTRTAFGTSVPYWRR